jgi:hypothetical protein
MEGVHHGVRLSCSCAFNVQRLSPSTPSLLDLSFRARHAMISVRRLTRRSLSSSYTYHHGDEIIFLPLPKPKYYKKTSNDTTTVIITAQTRRNVGRPPAQIFDDLGRTFASPTACHRPPQPRLSLDGGDPPLWVLPLCTTVCMSSGSGTNAGGRQKQSQLDTIWGSTRWAGWTFEGGGGGWCSWTNTIERGSILLPTAHPHRDVRVHPHV